jgi:predicted  nucleic acid-binding Zn-ribbon protein
MNKVVKSIPGDPTKDILKKRIAKAERDLAKLDRYRESDRSKAEDLQAQIQKWREEFQNYEVKNVR